MNMEGYSVPVEKTRPVDEPEKTVERGERIVGAGEEVVKMYKKMGMLDRNGEMMHAITSFEHPRN